MAKDWRKRARDFVFPFPNWEPDWTGKRRHLYWTSTVAAAAFGVMLVLAVLRLAVLMFLRH